MLALAADAHAARQKAELHVLAEGRLAQAFAVRREERDHFLGRQTVRMLALDARELGLGERRRSGSAGLGRGGHGCCDSFHPIPMNQHARIYSFEWIYVNGHGSLLYHFGTTRTRLDIF